MARTAVRWRSCARRSKRTPALSGEEIPIGSTVWPGSDELRRGVVVLGRGWPEKRENSGERESD
ncbi:hypothetical protein M6B38_167735 [Iris pallida]|uniref:Uncharacterized protein n=1 Tax=Iris pallida TaxID=29817 RepID=A0AAX6EVQ0_IRIPA|nr:hypothetical protein M6B38_167735 [Iris pallida]